MTPDDSFLLADRPSHPAFRHQAFFYDDAPEYVECVKGFIEGALARRGGVLVALPGTRGDLVRQALRPSAGARFVDMCELGANPGRIIPAVTEFVEEQSGRPCRFVGESIWPGRSPSQQAEATRTDALINVALSPFPVQVLGLYHRTALAGSVLVDAGRTHPEVLAGGRVRVSPDYNGDGYVSSGFAQPEATLSEEVWPLAPLPELRLGADLAFDDLGAVRAHVRTQAERGGMQAHRLDDLVLAVDEISSNSVRHGGGSGLLTIRRDGGREGETTIVCEVTDSGCISDPLVGRRPPGPELEARGLWLVNQLSDLVEIRSGIAGSRVRIRFAC